MFTNKAFSQMFLQIRVLHESFLKSCSHLNNRKQHYNLDGNITIIAVVITGLVLD